MKKLSNIVPEYFNSENWLTQINGSVAHSVQNYGVVVELQTEYQNLKVVDSVDFGRCVFSDGILIHSEESFMVSETLVHPIMGSHSNPKQILILGGSSGTVAKEVLKYSSVTEIFILEKDKQLVNIYQKYLSENLSHMKDPKINLILEDPKDYIKKCPSSVFDIIIVDSIPTKGYVEYMYSNDFYIDTKRILKNDGCIVSTIGDIRSNAEQIARNYLDLSKSFFVSHYSLDTISSNIGFIYGAKGSENLPNTINNPEYEKILAQVKFLNKDMYKRLFLIPDWIQSIFKSNNINADVIHLNNKYKVL